MTEAHFTFTTLAAAAEALLVVLEDARTTEHHYSFSGLSPTRILKDGLHLRGSVDDISTRVGAVEGSIRQAS